MEHNKYNYRYKLKVYYPGEYSLLRSVTYRSGDEWVVCSSYTADEAEKLVELIKVREDNLDLIGKIQHLQSNLSQSKVDILKYDIKLRNEKVRYNHIENNLKSLEEKLNNG